MLYLQTVVISEMGREFVWKAASVDKMENQIKHPQEGTPLRCSRRVKILLPLFPCSAYNQPPCTVEGNFSECIYLGKAIETLLNMLMGKQWWIAIILGQKKLRDLVERSKHYPSNHIWECMQLLGPRGECSVQTLWTWVGSGWLKHCPFKFKIKKKKTCNSSL